MKKLLIIALLACGISAKSQTIDTAFHTIAACKIQPFKANFNDAGNVTHLGVRVINDNLTNSATLYWSLMDDTQNSYASGNTVITGSYYNLYANGSNTYPFTFIATLFNQIKFQ